MKTIKLFTALGLAGALLGLASGALAQTAGPTGGSVAAGPRAKARRTSPIQQALKSVRPSTDQVAKLKELFKTQMADAKAFRKAHKGDKPAMRAHAKDARKSLMDGIKGILSPEQFTQFQANLKELRRAHRKPKVVKPF